MIPGFVPGFLESVSTPAPTLRFTLYSRSYIFFFVGYWGLYDATAATLGTTPSFGSIDAQPLSGSTLWELFYTNITGAARITFSGNQAAALSGKTVWINGVEYATGFGAWTYNGSTRTSAEWSAGNAPILADFTTYSIEIK